MKHILLFLPFTALFTALVAVSIQIYLLIQHRRRERAEKTDLFGRYRLPESKIVESFTITGGMGIFRTDEGMCFCEKQLEFCSDKCPLFEYVIFTYSKVDHLGFKFRCPYFPVEYITEKINDERAGHEYCIHHPVLQNYKH